MCGFLGAHCRDYRIYIIEQSADGRKFNRGQLLNAGYVLARRDGCDAQGHTRVLQLYFKLNVWRLNVPEKAFTFRELEER